MSEKRFTLDLEANVDLPILVDNKTGKWWFIRDTTMNTEILCNLINEIVDENEQLKDVRENCRNQQVRQANTIHKLLQENEQLRQENNMLKITIDRNESYIMRLTHQSDWHY